MRLPSATLPSDVSVVSPGGKIPDVDMLSPPLTTVRIAQREMGSQAALILLEQIAIPDAGTQAYRAQAGSPDRAGFDEHLQIPRLFQIRAQRQRSPPSIPGEMMTPGR